VGRVTTPVGIAIAGAQVRLIDQRGDHKSTASDSKGYFELANITAGSYTLETSLKGFAPSASAPFPVMDGQRLSFSVVLQPLSTTSIVTLGHITVTGHDVLSNSSASTTTLTTQQFINSGQLRVDQGLSKLPGVTINYGGFAGYSAPGASSSLTVRGAGNPDNYGGDQSYENLVLQDGEPLRNGSTGGFDLSSITPAIYDRVELIKGVGGTSVFGANAIGGTLNLVTREPLRSEGGQVWYSVGSYGTTDFNVMQSNTMSRFGYLLDFHSYNTDGAIPSTLLSDYIGNFTAPDYTPANAIGTYYRPTQLITLKSGLIKLRYDLANSTFVTLTGSDETDFRDATGIYSTLSPLFILSTNTSPSTDPNGVTYYCCYPAEYKTNISPKGAAELHTQLGGGSLIIRAYDQLLQTVDSAQNGPATLAGGPAQFIQRSRDHLTGQLATWTKNVGKSTLTLAAGGNGDTYLQGFGFGPLSVNNLPAFGQGQEIERTYLLRDDLQASPKLNLVLTNYWSSYDTLRVHRYDPRLGMVYRPNTNTVVRASIGTGFAPPSLQQLYAPFSTAFYANLPQCPANNVSCGSNSGNPNLRAEKAMGYELASQHDFSGRGLVGLDLYRTNLTDHIYQGVVPAPPDLFHNGCCGTGQILYLLEPINITHAVYTGIEANGTLPLSRAFSLDGFYDVQAAYPTDVDPNLAKLDQVLVSNQQFIGVPLHKYSATLNYSNRAGTSAYISWDFIDRNNPYNQPAFSLYGGGINLPLGDYSLHVNANNIFSKYNLFFSQITTPFTGEPYPGYSGPFGTYAEGAPQHQLTVTLERKFGSLR